MVAYRFFLSVNRPAISSFCSAMLFVMAVNFFFMMPFSPFRRRLTSRCSFSLSSYFSLSSSISRSASSSSWFSRSFPAARASSS